MAPGLMQPDAVEVQCHRLDGILFQHRLIDGTGLVQAPGHVGVDRRVQTLLVGVLRLLLGFRHGLVSRKGHRIKAARVRMQTFVFTCSLQV